MNSTVILSIIALMILTVNCTTMILTFPCRFKLPWTIGVIAAFTAALFGFSIAGDNMGFDYGWLRGLLYLPLIMFLFKGSLFQKIYAFLLQLSLTVSILALSQTIIGLIVSYGSNAYNVTWLITSFVIYSGYIMIVFRFGRRMLEKIFINSRPLEWALYSFGAVFSFSVLAVSLMMPDSPSQKILMLLFIIWSFAVLCFAIINTHEKSKQRYEAEFVRSIISPGREHYQKMTEMYNALEILRRDYKDHINMISELVNAGDTDEIKKYLTDVKVLVSENELRHYCSNTVINALLSNYAERCKKLNIRYDVHLSMPETLSIPNYEMCIILGNLLENAVEACDKRDHGRRIELSVKTQGEQLAVMVRNSFDGVVVTAGGQPVSAKKDGGGGFGLRSVQAVAAHYDGCLLREWDNGTFTAYVTVRL